MENSTEKVINLRQEDEEEEEEAPSLCDLPMIHNSRKERDEEKSPSDIPRREIEIQEDFDFCSQSKESDMCAADEVFFQGQILPLRHSRCTCLRLRPCSPIIHDAPCTPLTDEQFILFHYLDCELYARLALSSRREPVVSMKFMAFWMWLETESHNTRLIRKILFLPPAELNKLTDETVTCLECVDCKDEFSFGNHEISLLPKLLSFRSRMMFSLRRLHRKRLEILGGVDRIIDTVCVRAFKGVMQQVLDENAAMQATEAAAERV